MPKTIEDLYTVRLETVTKIIKLREERNMGRRMVSFSGNYSWDATPWDWVLRELNFVGNDMTGERMWKKAAAFKLAKEAQIAVPKIMAEWKYRAVSTKIVALKTSAIIKQAFYEQYTDLKRTKDNSELIPDADNKRNRMGRRLRDIMRWTIVNHEFQYNIPTETYYSLCKQLNPKFEKRPRPSKLQEQTEEVQEKLYENDFFSMKLPSNDIGPPSVTLFDTYEYNDDVPRIMSLNDPFPDSLLASGPSALDDPAVNLDLTNLVEVPPCNYDEIIDDPLSVLEIPKNQEGKSEAMEKIEVAELKVLENLNEIFFDGAKEIQKRSSRRMNDEITFFDVKEELKHTLYKPEDEEFMDYINYLPECTDPLYQKVNKQ